jgi:hypothetical protein
MLNKTNLLHEQLMLTACKNATGEPVVSLLATQLFFGLSRVQVREFYQMLIDADKALYPLRHAQPGQEQQPMEEDDENIYETAMTTLQTKVRFVVRGVHQEPVAMLGLETLQCELTKDELIMLDQEVLWLLCDIKKDEANWFYAYQYSTDNVYHLMDKGHYDRYGAALCGSRPVLRVPVAEGYSLCGWFLLPLNKEEQLDEQRTCLACLTLWKQRRQTGEAYNSVDLTGAEQEQALRDRDASIDQDQDGNVL